MKRIFGYFFGIMAFVVAVSVFDAVFMGTFSKKMDEYLDEIEGGVSIETMLEKTTEMESYFNKNSFWLHRLVPTNRLEEIEVDICRLNSFLEVGDYTESVCLAAEINKRVEQLYSTGFYRWYQKNKKRIG